MSESQYFGTTLWAHSTFIRVQTSQVEPIELPDL